MPHVALWTDLVRSWDRSVVQPAPRTEAEPEARELVLAQEKARYLREPRLARRADGAIELHVLAWRGDHEAHLAIEVLLEPLGLGSERELARAPALPLLDHAPTPSVATEPASEDAATAGGWIARIERTDGISRLLVEHGDARTLVWQSRATAAAPAIAVAPGGVWVAFHHNLREDTLEADLPKWIALRFVDGAGRVFAPAAEMLGRDRDKQGEEQGFELPTLAVGGDGAVALFGRGSHCFYRQDVSAAGFGPRVALGSGDWGCRGRRVATLVVEGRVLTARRERTGIVLALGRAPTGGAPWLEPLDDAAVSLEARPHRDVPARPAGDDPARERSLVTLFGDIHQHSAHSDGCGTADEPYLRARHVYGDDFAALSDHESFLGKRIGPGEWQYLQAVAERHHDEGRFVTLLAYEWTGRSHPGPGHKVVYAAVPGAAIVSRDDVPEGTGLVSRLRGTERFCVPHHVGWTGADEAAHDPEVQPVFEICSCHGCYLHARHPLGARGELEGHMIEDLLRRGHRFGFIACSDGHGLLHHHGVGRKRDPFRSGLTAVLATERTRASIFAALRARRTYATSGVPIYLDVDAAGQPMGSAIASVTPVRVRARATGNGEVRAISIVTASGVAASAKGRGAHADCEASIEAGWAYARVEQTDGEMAWSSPVWIDRA